ncbi:glucose 1-dehydrogenase [Bacillus sp. S3]|uniref:SDR family NAD(P)-dependent oxidoreductase n=1 Tax=Bacillus sp. S3 TaxID=486398 RepID=UPI0011891152|nr:glucose 1-dehydrogenase [Bacillus sp. S3]QCJ44630.1 glucose 1-dehydrogenase [Bacillus sp. S3]
MNFEGKIAFITGAGRGIGKTAALLLAKYGADIVACDLNFSNLKETAEEVEALGRRAIISEVNVTNKVDIDKAVQQAVEEFGRIDILVNCAGIISTSLLVDAEEEMWDQIMGVNAKGTFLTCQSVAKQMIQQNSGKIVNISSIASKTAEYANGLYCTSKAAVNMISQTLALELAQYNINVNAICPAYTNTDMMQNVFNNRGPVEGMTPEEYQNYLTSFVPLGRMADPIEIAELIAFLSSDKSNFITGTTYTIAGGKELH